MKVRSRFLLKFLRFFVKSVDLDEVLVIYVRVLSGTFSRKKLKTLEGEGEAAVKVNKAKGKYYTNSIK